MGSEIKHCMIDVETMGLYPGCALLSIGAVTFDILNGVDDVTGTFKRNIDLQSCLDAGLTIDPRTEEWWSNQSQAARDALKDPAPVPLYEALDAFSSFYIESGAKRIWSHGASADIPWLEAAYRALDMNVPWHYRAPRDTRTLSDLDIGGVIERTIPRVEHCALQDAIAQARDVVAGLRLLVPATAG